MTLRSAGRVWSVGLGLLFLWNTGDADLLTDLVSAESLRCCRLLCEVCRASGGCVVAVALIWVLPELSRDGWCVVAWGSTVRFRFCAGDRSPAGLLTSDAFDASGGVAGLYGGGMYAPTCLASCSLAGLRVFLIGLGLISSHAISGSTSLTLLMLRTFCRAVC